MSNFVIIRHKKLKSVGHVQAAINHNDRTTEPLNADPSQRHLNKVEGGGMVKLRKNLASVTQASTAKEPVLAIEYIVSASPEQINDPSFDREGYFKAARAYLDKLVGAGNLIHSAEHYDERSAHGHFIYTPIIELEASTRRRSVVVGKTEDGKQKREVKEFPTQAGRALNAKKFTGREASIQLQSDFATQVGMPFGLRRGVERSRAKHTEIKAFYTQIKQDMAEVEAQRRQLAEREVALDKRDGALSQRKVDLFTERLALDEKDRAGRARLQARIDEMVGKLEAREQAIQDQEAAFDGKLEELDRVLGEREKALQEREKAVKDNPPNPELKKRSNALDAIVGLLQRDQYERLSPEHQREVRQAKVRNDERGYNR
jgi:hypothetical protein